MKTFRLHKNPYYSMLNHDISASQTLAGEQNHFEKEDKWKFRTFFHIGHNYIVQDLKLVNYKARYEVTERI